VIPGADPTSPARPLTPTAVGKLNKKKTGPTKAEIKAAEELRKNTKAWIAGLRELVPYDATPLLNGQRVSLSNDMFQRRMQLTTLGAGSLE
jgi:hypothetical protein